MSPFGDGVPGLDTRVVLVLMNGYLFFSGFLAPLPQIFFFPFPFNNPNLSQHQEQEAKKASFALVAKEGEKNFSLINFPSHVLSSDLDAAHGIGVST